MTKSLVYYTCNREDPMFEERIKATLVRESGGLPLISVSQKPIDFGKNICVGEVGVSGHNAWRQFQIGAKEATSTYVYPVEADFIYPKEFFEYDLTEEDIFYRFYPVWILFARPNTSKVFYKKVSRSHGCMVAGRQFFIDNVERVLKGRGMWQTEPESDLSVARLPDLLDPKEVRTKQIVLNNPIISFKTGSAMHSKSPILKSTACRELAGIGSAHDLIKEYMQ